MSSKRRLLERACKVAARITGRLALTIERQSLSTKEIELCARKAVELEGILLEIIDKPKEG